MGKTVKYVVVVGLALAVGSALWFNVIQPFINNNLPTL